MLEVNPKEARYTPKEHHDLVCENLAINVEKVCQSSFVDKVEIFKRDKKRTQCIFKDKPLDFKANMLTKVLDNPQTKLMKEAK